MNKPKIFIACDTNKISDAKKIIAQTKTNKLDVGYKFGLELFYSKGGRQMPPTRTQEQILRDSRYPDLNKMPKDFWGKAIQHP